MIRKLAANRFNAKQAIQLTTRILTLLVTLLVTFLSVSLTSHADLDLPETVCSFEGVFKQSKTLNGSVEPLESSGEYFYHCQYGVIWASQQPTQEILVLSNNGQSYLVQDQGLKKMPSRSGKFISRLLIGLMGGDASMIEQQFDVLEMEQDAESELTANALLSKKLVLTPKKRQLKRAIKAIEFITIAEQADSQPVANIRITDRNDQVTEIEAVQTHQYDTSSSVLENCMASAVAKSDQADSNGGKSSVAEQSDTQASNVVCSALLGTWAKAQ